MTTQEKPPQSLPKLITCNKGLKLAEKWVKNMPGDVDEAKDIEMEGRPARLGLGAKVPRKSQVGPLNDPVERRLHRKFGLGSKKTTCIEDSPTKNEIANDDEDDENLDSRTNAFAKKRAAPFSKTPQAKKKLK